MLSVQTENAPNEVALRGEYPVISKRQVFVGEEQGEIPVPIELIFKGGNLDIYEDVLRRNFFRLFLKANKLTFQAAGFLGIIPINDSVAIEVCARVPLGAILRTANEPADGQPLSLEFSQGFTDQGQRIVQRRKGGRPQ